MNQMMIATFFLVGMDIGHRILRWFGGQPDRLGPRDGGHRRQAGPGDGRRHVEYQQRGGHDPRCVRSSVAGGADVHGPHAPVFATPQHGDLSEVKALEPTFRAIWNNIRATQELGPLMFDGYPRYVPGGAGRPRPAPRAYRNSDMPKIHSADDMLAMVTRLRVVLEDPRQLLSGCVVRLRRRAAGGQQQRPVAG